MPEGPGKRGHIVADTNVSPFARMRNICYGHKFCVRDAKNVSDFVQKHFVSATNVSQLAQPKKHHGQQCVRNKVSSFTRALIVDSGCALVNYLTNRFYAAVRLFSNRSQMTSKCGKNKKVAHEAIAECVTDVLTTF